MYTYSRYPKRVRAVEIVKVKGKTVVDSRGDTRRLSTSKAQVGDYIIVETDVEDIRTNTTCERWVPRAEFLEDYYMD